MLKDTIISAFNYDGTLLKWLKKVEKALQDDTLTNIEVVTNSDYSMQLKLTFGDGTFILSPTFTNKGRGIVSISKTATSGLVDTYTVTYTDNTTSTFTVTNAEGFNVNNLYSTLTAGTGIELTKDDQHVTVKAKSLLSDIVDANGNKRFIERNGNTPYTAEGFAITYAKASLSGSHLLIVLAGNVSQAFTVGSSINLIKFTLPAYVYNKIVPLWASVFVEAKQIIYRSDQWTSQTQNVVLARDGNNTLIIRTVNDFTATYDEHFRIQFDLLIDAE